MISFHFTPEHVYEWLLNVVMLGFFLLELSIAAYVTYLIVNHVPK